MAKIYPTDVFEKQTNGTIFYREGKLNDFPQAKNGIFQSWKYDFDAGRQVFRATEEEGKIYEKRLVKDIHGVARWTGWMEIPDGEANGIQAIAVNDRPLQLPNSDGAIKLQITPEIIDTYSKIEIYELIQQKIADNQDRMFTYVRWIKDPDTNAWATTAERVLNLTFPDGGVVERFYLVEPKPGQEGINNTATYWIWDMKQTPTPHETWVEIDAPDLRAYVTFPVFNDHVNDTQFHLKGDGSERKAWNENIELSEKTAESLDEHIRDIGAPVSVHVTPEEREKWNITTEAIKPFPQGTDRYVVSQGEYVKAFEQVEKGSEGNRLAFSTNNISLQEGGVLATNLGTHFDALTDGHNEIEAVQIEIGSLNTQQTFVWLETDQGQRSEKWSSTSTILWKLSGQRFNRITLHLDDITRTALLHNVRIYLLFKPVTSVNIGDPTRALPVNLIGPVEGEPLYNGVPISQALKSLTTEWGHIVGDINKQTDLKLKLADLLEPKVNGANANDTRRWDVFRNTIIPSLIQQEIPEENRGQFVIDVGNKNNINIDQPIVENIGLRVTELLNDQKIPFDFRLEIGHVATNNNPVFFGTDKGLVAPSATVTDGKFEWYWPGPTFELFDKIIVKGHTVSSLSDIKLTINWIKYSDVVAEAPGFNWTQNAKDYFLNASGNIYNRAENGILDTFIKNKITYILENENNFVSGNVVTTIKNDRTTNIGNDEIVFAKSFQVEAKEKIDLETETFDIRTKELDIKIEEDIKIEAENIDLEAEEIKVYNQEIDERYLISGEITNEKAFEIVHTISGELEVVSGEVFNNTLRISGLHTIMVERAFELENNRVSGDLWLSGLINEVDNKVESISGYLDENYYTKDEIDDTLENYYTREETDDLLDEKADKEDVYTKDEVYNKEETYNRPEIDALITTGMAMPLKEFNNVRGDTEIELEPGFSVYKFVIHAPSKITFKNVVPNRKYTFYFDQIDIVYPWEIGNIKFNADDLTKFDESSINFIPNMRTVVDVIGTEELGPDGFIVNYVIPKVACNHISGYRIIVGNIEGLLYDNIRRDKAVDALGRKTGEIYSYSNANGVVQIRSQFMNGDGVIGRDSGWRNPDDGRGWILYEKSNPSRILDYGLIGEHKFFNPEGMNLTGEDLILDFRPARQMIEVQMHPSIPSGYVTNTTGFNGVLYQAYYEEIKLEIFMYSNNTTQIGYFIWKMTNSIGMEQLANSFAWKFFARRLPEVMNGNIAILHIEPSYYHKIFVLDYKINNHPITDTKNLVWFEDERMNNTIEFIIEPLGVNDPITIIDCTPNIEVIGSTQGINSWGRIRVIEEPKDGDTARFTIQTASGLSKIVNVLVLREIKELLIEGQVIANRRGIEDFIHKTPSRNEEYEAHINWGNSYTADRTGTWSVDGNTFSVEPAVANSLDKAIITALSIGSSTLVFTPTFDPTKVVRLPIEVYVHLYNGEINNHPVRTSNGYNLGITWFDNEGNIFNPTGLTDIRGKWEIISDDKERATIGEETGRLVISDKPIPIGTDYEILTIRFTSVSNLLVDKLDARQGPSLILTQEFRVFRNEYWLTFITSEDEHSLGVNVSTPAMWRADDTISVQLNFTNGFMASDKTAKQIDKLPNVRLVHHQNGATRFTFEMPYNNVIINVTTKEI